MAFMEFGVNGPLATQEYPFILGLDAIHLKGLREQKGTTLRFYPKEGFI